MGDCVSWEAATWTESINSREHDLISRREAIHALCKAVHKDEDVPCENQTVSCLSAKTRVCDFAREIYSLPSVKQEDAISLDWISKHLEWLDNCDNDFAQLAKVSIRAMVETWKKDKT